MTDDFEFDKDSYKVSGGLHGVGVSCVNALSSHLEAIVYRNGKIFKQEYERGIPLGDVKTIGETEKTGTEVTFKPDQTIFIEHIYHYDILSARMRELSFLNKGIHLNITDKRRKDEETGELISNSFYSEGGLKEFVELIDKTREKLIENVIHIEEKKKNEGI